MSYRIDGKFGYALSGDMNKATLLRVVEAVYTQLAPPINPPSIL